MSEPCQILSLPPVSEVNHSIGACYCHLCTCGEHLCPGDKLKTSKYLPSSLKSIYKQDYQKKKRIASK